MLDGASFTLCQAGRKRISFPSSFILILYMIYYVLSMIRFYRKSFESPNYVFNLTWILDREQFETFMDWWIDGLEEGMVTARIMCISQGPSPISHIGHIIPGSLNVVEQKGLAYTVTAQFEARPAKRYGT